MSGLVKFGNRQLIVIAGVLVACGLGYWWNENRVARAIEEAAYSARPLALDLPKASSQIQPGMTFDEVVALVGKPESTDDLSRVAKTEDDAHSVLVYKRRGSTMKVWMNGKNRVVSARLD